MSFRPSDFGIPENYVTKEPAMPTYTARPLARPQKTPFGTMNWEVVNDDTGTVVMTTTGGKADAEKSAANLNAGLTVNGEVKA